MFFVVVVVAFSKIQINYKVYTSFQAQLEMLRGLGSYLCQEVGHSIALLF